jgi:glutamyl-tRNA reductase
MVIAMTIVRLSLSHRFVPVELLEKLAVPAGELGEVLARLHAVPGVEKAVILSTCNRVEVYAALSGPARRVTGAVTDLLAARGQVPADQITQMARILPGGAAAAGRTTGPAVTGLINAALQASKRARTQTAISTEGISLARTGLDLAAAHLGGFAEARAAEVAAAMRAGPLRTTDGRLAGVTVAGTAEAKT